MANGSHLLPDMMTRRKLLMTIGMVLSGPRSRLKVVKLTKAFSAVNFSPEIQTKEEKAIKLMRIGAVVYMKSMTDKP